MSVAVALLRISLGAASTRAALAASRAVSALGDGLEWLHRGGPPAPGLALAGGPSPADSPRAPGGLVQQQLEELAQHIWMAVPKRKQSYRRKRVRQMHPSQQLEDVQVGGTGGLW